MGVTSFANNNVFSIGFVFWGKSDMIEYEV